MGSALDWVGGCAAGVMATPLEYTKDGLELQWGTNHIAHYYLTTLLLDKLRASAPARVVSLASTAHGYAPREGPRLGEARDAAAARSHRGTPCVGPPRTRRLVRRHQL